MILYVSDSHHWPSKEEDKMTALCFSPSDVIMFTYLLGPFIIAHLLCCIPSKYTAKQDKRRNGE